ncbi:RCC1 domain-containing protein [Bifidobacterium leontopitheci]|uniref:Type IV secretion protein Rhs n=1 Tax=Bifidobacterium leontopitheci TaxID=2650774 RepID=A0A6I1GGA3_9BIFI|nr:hypothetical protein [Bifidobacterium leontopitheci]KAB7790605.1 type IV secretion protein Rhs [Bifidobacterium leontopitheci]
MIRPHRQHHPYGTRTTDGRRLPVIRGTAAVIRTLLTVLLIAATAVAQPAAAAADAPRPAIATMHVANMLDSGDDRTSITVAISNGQVYAKPSDIAAMTGMDVDVTAQSIIFRRGWYAVAIMRSLGYAQVFLQQDDQHVLTVIDDVFFMPPLETNALGVVVPLEKTLYLANAGWTVDSDHRTLTVDAPKATFWNVFEQFTSLRSDLASAAALLAGGSFTDDPNDPDYLFDYNLGFFLKHFDASVLVPLPGNTYSDKIADLALKSLLTDELKSVPDSDDEDNCFNNCSDDNNKNDENKNAAISALDYLNTPQKFFKNFNKTFKAAWELSGSAQNALEAKDTLNLNTWLTKQEPYSDLYTLIRGTQQYYKPVSGMTDWQTLTKNMPDSTAAWLTKADAVVHRTSTASDILSSAFTYLNAMKTAGQVGNSYIDQLQSLQSFDSNTFSDAISQRNATRYKKRAKALMQRAKEPMLTSVNDVLTKEAAKLLSDTVIEQIPYGKQIKAGWSAISGAMALIPVTAEFMKEADDGMTAYGLISIAMMSYLNTQSYMGKALGRQSDTDLASIRSMRNSLLLTIRSTMRFYDLVYGLRQSAYLKALKSGPKSERTNAYTKKPLTEEEMKCQFGALALPQQWARRAHELQTLALALTSTQSWASAGYDGAIDLQSGFENLYNDSYAAGPLREKIPTDLSAPMYNVRDAGTEGTGSDTGKKGTDAKRTDDDVTNPFDQGGVIDAADFGYNGDGTTYAMALQKDGTVKQWDDSSHGVSLPGPGKRVDGLPKIAAIYGDSNAARYAVDTSGQLWAWGYAGSLCGSSSLGTGVREQVPGSDGKPTMASPAKVIGMDDVRQVSSNGCGTFYALQGDGTVWTWGHRYSTSMSDVMIEPVRIKALNHVKAISALGGITVIALKDDGSLVQATCPTGDCNPAGLAEQTVDGAPDDVATLNTYEGGYAFIDKKGTAWKLDYPKGEGTSYGDRYEATRFSLPAWVRMRMVYTQDDMVQDGSDTAYALGEDGSLWGWGVNGGACAANDETGSSDYSGAIGDGTCNRHDKPVKIMDDVRDVKMSYGGRLTYVLKTDGSVWTWGAGEGNDASWNMPKKVGGITSATRLAHHHVVLTDGSVQRLDFAREGSLYPYKPIKDVGTTIQDVDLN